MATGSRTKDNKTKGTISKEIVIKEITKKLKARKYVCIAAISLIVFLAAAYYFTTIDESFYSKTIAKVVTVDKTAGTKLTDMNGNVEQLYNEKVDAIVMNGAYKGQILHLQNKTSCSQAYDLDLKTGDEVFLLIKAGADKNIVSAEILDLKRDKYTAFIAILFILLILLVGGIKGLKSLTSVIANVIIFTAVIELYIRGWNLFAVSAAASIIFIIVSISIVSGLNRKTASAIIGTMAGTLFSMLITAAVFLITNSNGVHYEEMEFLTHPPRQLFMAEVLIGTLGGIMDIAISIASAINELYDSNPGIDRKTLIKSGMEIGKDIMGTMANTLVFAYISGSIPMILLWLKNGFPFTYIVNFNLSLEIIRALTGSIGIVSSIPITLYISVMLLKIKGMRETGETGETVKP